MMDLNQRKRKQVTRGHIRNRPSKYVKRRGKLHLRRPERRRGWIAVIATFLSSLLGLGRRPDDGST